MRSIKIFITIFFLALSISGFSQFTKVIAPMGKNNPLDTTYATNIDSLGSGGFITFPLKSSILSLPFIQRRTGQFFYAADMDSFYQFKGGINNANLISFKSLSASSTPPGGISTNVQFNDGGVLGGNSGFTYNKINRTVNVDSIHTKTVNADSVLAVPLVDTLRSAIRKGEIRFDTAKNQAFIKINGQWTNIATYANSLIPNRPNMRMGIGTIRPTIIGSAVQWNFIVDPQHDSLFFTGCGSDNGSIFVYYPNVTKIHTFVIVPDESFAGLVDVGASVQTNQAVIRMFRRVGVKSGTFIGNGVDYTPPSLFTTAYASSVGGFVLKWSSGFTPADAVVTYTGKNNYHLERTLTGTGAYDQKYFVRDMFGNAVTDAPAATDMIQAIVGDQYLSSVNPSVVAGDGWAAGLFTSFANLWIIAIFEL